MSTTNKNIIESIANEIVDLLSDDLKNHIQIINYVNSTEIIFKGANLILYMYNLDKQKVKININNIYVYFNSNMYISIEGYLNGRIVTLLLSNSESIICCNSSIDLFTISYEYSTKFLYKIYQIYHQYNNNSKLLTLTEYITISLCLCNFKNYFNFISKHIINKYIINKNSSVKFRCIFHYDEIIIHLYKYYDIIGHAYDTYKFSLYNQKFYKLEENCTYDICSIEYNANNITMYIKKLDDIDEELL